MPERYEVRKFTDDLTDAAAKLLAERHRRHRQAVPALDPAYEDAPRCAQLITERFASDDALGGAMATNSGHALTMIASSSTSGRYSCQWASR